MALPQSVLRRRTRNEALRQRQTELRRRIEQPTPTATPQEFQEFSEAQQQIQQQQAEIQSVITNINQQISTRTEDLQSVQRRIQEIQDRGGSTPSGLRATANNLSTEIGQLQSRKSILTDSFTLEEARIRQSVFERQSAAEIARRQEPEIITRTAEQIQNIRESEMFISPVMLDGQRIRVPRQPSFADVPRVQGAVTPTIPSAEQVFGEPTKEFKILAATGDVLFGETGKQFVGIGRPDVGIQSTFLGKGIVPDLPFIPASRISEEVSKFGLVGRTAAQFIPQTPGEVGLFAGVGVAAVGSGIIGATTRVAMRTIGGYTALKKDLPTEQRIAGGIVALLPFAGKFIKGGIKKVSEFKTIGKKGSAQFTELERFFKKDASKKSELQKVLDGFSQELNFKRQGKVIRTTTKSEKVELIRNVLDKIKSTADPELKKLQLEGLVKTLKAELGDQGARNLFGEVLAQEGISAITPKQTAEVGNIKRIVNVELQKVGVVPISLIQSDQSTSQKSLFFTTEITATAQQPAEKQIPALGTRTAQIEQQISRQFFFQNQIPGQALAQPQVLAQPSLPSFSFGFKTPTITKGVPKVGFFPKVRITLPTKTAEKVRAALAKLKGKAVNVEVGMERGKRKVIFKSLPPKLALKKAQQYVDENIQASFKLVKVKGKPTRKDIKSVRLSGKFRPSKRDPLFQVEKRRFRLDSAKERKQIQKAKRVKFFK